MGSLCLGADSSTEPSSSGWVTSYWQLSLHIGFILHRSHHLAEITNNMTHWQDLGHHEWCKPMINLWLMEQEGKIYTSLPGHWLLPVPWQVLLEGPIYFANIATPMVLFASFDGCNDTNMFSAFRCTKYCPNWYCRREVMKPWKGALIEVS